MADDQATATETATDEAPTATANGSLHGAILACVKAIGAVGKHGENTQQGYRYQRAADVAAAVNKATTEHGLTIVPTLLPESLVTVQSGTTRNGAPTFRTEALLRVRVTHAASGEYLELIVPGSGQDTGEKGVYKAMTGAMKYAQRLLFNIPDD